MNKTELELEKIRAAVEKRKAFPILTVLGILFIALKLTGHITWSWLWVLAPFWGPFAFVFGVLAIIFFFALIVFFIGAIATAFSR